MVTARLRRWRRNPLLEAHHLATITLGMAAVTAVVSLMLAMAFQPLPFRDSAQLIQVWNRVQSGVPVTDLLGSELSEIEEGTRDIFMSLGGFVQQRFWLVDDQGSSGPMRIARMEEAAFHGLDLMPVLGRPVVESMSSMDGLGPVWISHNLWQSRYGGRTSVIGEIVRLSLSEAGTGALRSEIAGVMPPDLRIPSPGISGSVDLWAILPAGFKVRAANASAFRALGRLRPDRRLADAQAALTVLADRRSRPIDRRNRPVVQTFEEIAYGPARRTMAVLAVGLALVLLLALANLASLTVAEGSRRQLELFIQTALGASRWRLWRDLVADHVALTMCALSLGLPLAWLTLQGLTRLATAADLGPPLAQPPALDVYVMIGFSVCALLAPLAWSTLIVRGMEARHSDLRAGLFRLGALSVQACLGIALIVLAVSMARIYARLTEANLGPAPGRTAFFSVNPEYRGLMTDAQAADFNAQALERVRALPDVQATALASNFPPYGSPRSFWKQGDLADSPRETNYPITVSHDYFSTLGIPILVGRGFEESDRYAGKPVAIIDREMARRNWDSPQEAVNAQIHFGSSTKPYEVIGVAGSFNGYWAPEAIPTIYLSQNQDPTAGGTIILRTGAPAPGIGERARQVLGVDLPFRAGISTATTLQAGWQATATRPRARMVGMLLLALVGVGLGAQGVYALAASIVAARRQELAIRTALGASGPALVWLVLRQLIVAVIIGSGIGMLGVLAVRQLAPQWISASVSDPAPSIAVAIAVLLSTAVLGGFLPARSATRAPVVAWLRR